jgi:hypothetical protein
LAIAEARKAALRRVELILDESDEMVFPFPVAHFVSTLSPSLPDFPNAIRNTRDSQIPQIEIHAPS